MATDHIMGHEIQNMGTVYRVEALPKPLPVTTLSAAERVTAWPSTWKNIPSRSHWSGSIAPGLEGGGDIYGRRPPVAVGGHDGPHMVLCDLPEGRVMRPSRTAARLPRMSWLPCSVTGQPWPNHRWGPFAASACSRLYSEVHISDWRPAGNLGLLHRKHRNSILMD